MLCISPDALIIRLIEAEDGLSIGVRGLLVGISVLLFCAAFNRGRFLSVAFSGAWVKAAYAASFCFGLTCFTYAVNNTGVFNVLVIIMTAPIMSAVGAQFIRGEPIDRALWIVSVLVMVCVAAILWSDLEGGHIWGDLAAFGVTVTLAFNANLVRHHRDMDTVSGLAFGGLLAGAIHLPLSDFGTFGEMDWLWLGVNGLFLMPAAVILMNFASRRLPPPEMNLLFVIEMVLSPLLVWFFLGEVPKREVLVAGLVATGLLVGYYSVKLAPSRP